MGELRRQICVKWQQEEGDSRLLCLAFIRCARRKIVVLIS